MSDSIWDSGRQAIVMELYVRYKDGTIGYGYSIQWELLAWPKWPKKVFYLPGLTPGYAAMYLLVALQTLT